MRPLVRRLFSFTSTGRGLGGPLEAYSGACCCDGGLPTRWTTSISSGTMGGWSFRFTLQMRRILSSRRPSSSSGRPNTRIKPMRPCCSRSSRLTSSWSTCCWSLEMFSSRSVTCLRKAELVALSPVMASSSFLMTGYRDDKTCFAISSVCKASLSFRIKVASSSPFISDVAVLLDLRRDFQDMRWSQYRIMSPKWLSLGAGSVPGHWILSHA